MIDNTKSYDMIDNTYDMIDNTYDKRGSVPDIIMFEFRSSVAISRDIFAPLSICAVCWNFDRNILCRTYLFVDHCNIIYIRTTDYGKTRSPIISNKLSPVTLTFEADSD